MNKNGPINKLRQWIQDNFFGIIILLVLILLVTLIASLFIPISVNNMPNSSLELEKYSAGVDQRTIIIRSISYIISGVSVVIAFTSLLQSKNSEQKRERLQVMPFPAYTLPLENVQFSSNISSKLILKKEQHSTDTSVEAEFNITIKNIGLGSLVDFEIKEAYYRNSNGKLDYLDVSFLAHFILGKQETIQMVIHLLANFASNENGQPKNLEQISLIASFNDLLGHRYEQEFTIQSNLRSFEKNELTKPEETNKKYVTYGLRPKQINHTHPYEQ